MKTIVTDRGDAGRRIDIAICRHLAGSDGVSRTRAQLLIEQGLVHINGKQARRSSQRAAAGDSISVLVADAEPKRAMRGEEPGVPLRILYEDDHLLAVDKPAGAIVHPTYRHEAGTLMNALVWRAREWPSGHRPALVGRLDKDTSGVLLVSKVPAVHAALQRATASGAGTKAYLAVVYGRIKTPRGVIDLPLHADPSDRRRTTAGHGGAPSLTRFERVGQVRAPRAGLALVRCTLGSGRRHQIRAHLAARSWPIVGDRVYGEPRWQRVDDVELADALRLFPRQALHAERLEFVHPVTGRRMSIVSPVPQDIADLLAAAGL